MLQEFKKSNINNFYKIVKEIILGSENILNLRVWLSEKMDWGV
jgi:hypothetical protein